MPSEKNIKIANIQFLLSVMVVLIHSMTIFINLPGKETQYIYGKNITTFIQIFIGDGISRVAVPLFLILSGYLFYKNFDGSLSSYKYKLKRRFISLVIPYLFWSIVTFFAFYFAQKIPAVAPYFSTRNAGQLSLQVFIENVIINSYNSPLWFCRYLIVFAILSVFIYYLLKRVPVILLLVTLYGWLIGFPVQFDIRMDALFFYILGAAIAVHYSKCEKISSVIWNENNRKMVIFPLFLIWIGILVWRTLHYCVQSPEMMLNGTYDKFVLMTGNIGIIVGVPAFWGLYDLIFKETTKIWNLSAYSFLIFVCHHPLVNTLKKLIMKIIGVSEFTSLLTYFAASFISIVLIIFAGWVTKKYFNGIWRFVSGGR